MRDLGLDQLRSFTDVVELGSFSAAAERRGLTQPAISLQLRQLERRLGVRLIERVGRRAGPTAAGMALIAHARRIERAVGEALEELAPHAAGVAGRVRIGTGATACIYLLPDVLRGLRQRFPALEITVRTGNTAEVLKAIEENALDLGLVTLPAPGRAFAVTPALADEFLLFSPLASQPPAIPLTPEAVAALPLVLYEPGGHTRRVVDEWFAAAGLHPVPSMSLGSVEAIKELVGAGLGHAILPGMAWRDSDAPRLSARSLAPRLERQLALVLRRDKPRHPGLREMLRALEACFASRGGR